MLPGIPIGDVRWGTLATQASGTTLVVPYPAQTRPDDVIALFAFANIATLYTSLGGAWTDDVRAGGTGSTLPPSLYVAHRLSTAALGGTTFNLTCPNVNTRARTVAIPAVDLAAILDTPAATTFVDQSAGGTANTVVPAGSFSRQHGLIVAGYCDNTAAHTSTQPAGFTEMEDGDGTVPKELCYLLQTALGTTGSMTNVFSGVGKALGQALCFKPRTASPAMLLAA